MTQDLIQHLRIERRSYIVGTLVVWAVIVVTWIVLYAAMEPQLFTHPSSNLHDAMARFVQPTGEQLWILTMAWMVGAIALFFLNWRFSVLLQRPRGAFGGPRPQLGVRWLWWAALSLNSMFYVQFLLPQLIVTAILAHWGKQEIERRVRLQEPPRMPL